MVIYIFKVWDNFDLSLNFSNFESIPLTLGIIWKKKKKKKKEGVVSSMSSADVTV